MSSTLKLQKLSKCYGKARVVDDFDLEVEAGSICGLIGPNGAGKTTIMKMIAGLTLPKSGTIELFGEAKNIDRERRRVSFLIENPMLDINMNARQNMEYIRLLKGIAEKERIDETLEFVGLKDAKDKKVRAFSLGMRQRLAIGMAILSKPELLVLDEPVNGLDPEGIVDVRNMLVRLAKEENVTILISSHLLAELSELCTDYAIINHGTLIEKISSDELKTRCEHHLTVKTDDVKKTAVVLEQKLGLHDYKVLNGEEIHIFERYDELETISKAITSSGLTILKFVNEGASLEEYYLTKVGGRHD